MQEDFAERFAYWMFRAVVRSTTLMGPIRLRRLKELLKLAAYDELRAQGRNKSSVAVSLGVSQALITDIASRLTKPGNRPGTPAMARTIPQLLFDQGGSLNEHKLEELLRPAVSSRVSGAAQSEEPDPGFYNRMETTLRELTRWGVLQKTRRGADVRFSLTQKGREQVLSNLSQPYADQNDILDDVLSLSRILLARGASLRSELVEGAAEASMTETRMRAALDWCEALQEEGKQSPILIKDGPNGRLFSAHSDAFVTPDEVIDEHQMAILELVRRLKEFVAWIASEPPAAQIAMKVVTLRISPHDLQGFLTAHREWVYAELERLEASAQSDPSAMTYILTWFGEVLPEP